MLRWSCASSVLIAARSARSKPLQISILKKLTRILRTLLVVVVVVLFLTQDAWLGASEKRTRR